MALKQKLRETNMLCESFSLLEILETSPSFHITVKNPQNFFQQNQVYLSYFSQLFVVTFANFLTKGVFIKISVTILDCLSFQMYVTFGMDGFN